jgi:hypothetical protein
MKVGDLVDEANLFSLLCKQYNGRDMKIVLALNGQKYTIVRIGKNIVNIMFKAEGRRYIFENGSYEVQVDEIQHLCLAESNVVFTVSIGSAIIWKVLYFLILKTRIELLLYKRL